MEDPSILSVLPAFLALGLAIVTRHVILALSIGVFSGMTIYSNFNPLKGVVNFFEMGVFAQLVKPANARIIIIICIIGGFVYLLEKSGGMNSFAKKITSLVNSPKKAQLLAWFGGMVLFFTDSGNSLILGPMFRPIFKTLKICREKLAFIVDSTSAPVCVLIPFIGWGVYTMSLIRQSYEPLGIAESPLIAFLNVIPFQFYPLLAIFSVPVLILTGKEYGPMARFQAEKTHGYESEGDEVTEPDQKHAGATAIFIPLGTMLVVLFSMFFCFAEIQDGALSLPGKKIQTSLAIAYLSAVGVFIFLLKQQKVCTIKKSFELFFQGMSRMMLIVVVLLLAWSMGDVCSLLHTGDFIAKLFGPFFNPGFLPAIIFLIGTVASMSTGSSWGTFALLMPIAIPVAHEVGAPMYVVIASVLSGGMVGDHASPISDTTILSSMSSGCKHADHVNTQLPYVCTTGAVAFVSFLIAGFIGSAWVLLASIIIQIVVILLVTRLLGRSSPQV